MFCVIVFCYVFLFSFFFFKQKTAYDMRISDWSSDVCSSDLNRAPGRRRWRRDRRQSGPCGARRLLRPWSQVSGLACSFIGDPAIEQRVGKPLVDRFGGFLDAFEQGIGRAGDDERLGGVVEHRVAIRSEEHKSELQSPM